MGCSSEEMRRGVWVWSYGGFRSEQLKHAQGLEEAILAKFLEACGKLGRKGMRHGWGCVEGMGVYCRRVRGE